MQSMATVVSNFVLALLALLAHPQTPKQARTLFKDAAVEFINHSKGGFPPGETLQDGLLRAFGVKSLPASTLSANLPKVTASEYAPDKEATELCVYAELGCAVATIEKHRAYLPTSTTALASA